MPFSLVFSEDATQQYQNLLENPALAKRLKAVRKALGLLEINPRHPSLNTHKYSILQGANGEEVFEAYAENHTPIAYRIFWNYGIGKNIITILAITPHP